MLPLRTFIRANRFISLLFVGTGLILAVILVRLGARNIPEWAIDNPDRDDKLAYVSDEGHLMLYDPRDRTEITLLDNVQNFMLAHDGRVAFTRPDETDNDLYVYDPSTPALAPLNITQNAALNNYPLAWSPDGHYLAFVSYRESSDQWNHIWNYRGHYRVNSKDQSLYVWDGENMTNIMPESELGTADTFYGDWSHDGRLAFTIQHQWSNPEVPDEIYLWDGDTTTNLSQNPEGSDWGASWSENGQLLFVLQRADEGGTHMWDGVSFKDGSPDADSFVRIAPELQPASVTWTDDNDIVGFTMYPESSSSGVKEIVLWDIENEAIVEQFSVSSDKAGSWLAEGGQVILSSHLASGIPSAYLDVENTEGEILFSDHVGELVWSTDGYLAYCGIEGKFSRLLSIWDGVESWVVARVSYRPVQWQHGRHIFSCNNG